MDNGFVYVLSNKCVVSRSGKRVYKVGFARDMPSRLGTLNTASPENFKVEALFQTTDYKTLEKKAKCYIHGALLTSDGSTTEFFDKPLNDIVSKIKLCASHEKLKLKKLNGAIYVGRSASMIRSNLKHGVSLANTWKNPTELAKAFIAKYEPGKTAGGVCHILTKFSSCNKGKWRERLAKAGLKFDRDGFVTDWRKAKKPL